MKSEKFNKFYQMAEKDLQDHEIEIILRKRKKIKMKDNTYCAGYFDGETLAVATKHYLSEEVFVHEYCHFLQYKEDNPLWKSIQKDDIFTRLEKKHFGIKDWKTVYNTIALERDCEYKALKLSKKYKLFDNAAYAQKANAYLYYYQYVFLKSGWIDSSKIYSKKIIDKMPTKLLPLSAFKKIDMEIMQIFEKNK